MHLALRHLWICSLAILAPTPLVFAGGTDTYVQPTVIATVPQLMGEINLVSKNLLNINLDLTSKLSLAPKSSRAQTLTAWFNQNLAQQDELSGYLLQLYLAVPLNPTPVFPDVTSYPASFSAGTVRYLTASQLIRQAITDAQKQTAQSQLSQAMDTLSQEAKQKPFLFVTATAPSFFNAAQKAAWDQKQALILQRETLRYQNRFATDAALTQTMNGWISGNQALLDQLDSVITQAFLNN